MSHHFAPPRHTHFAKVSYNILRWRYVLRASDDTITFGSPVNARDEFIVVIETIDFREHGAFLGVDVDVFRVGTDGYFRAVSVEGEGYDGACEKLMDLRSWHFEVEERRDGEAVDRWRGWIVRSSATSKNSKSCGDRSTSAQRGLKSDLSCFK